MKKLTLLLMAVLACFNMYAQYVTVSGTVVSEQDKEPLIGATVMVKGTTMGTATDIDGKFSVQTANGKTLVFSYVGYESYEMKVSGPQSNLIITLKESSQLLDDVVVVGYGTQKKSVVTAAISKVDDSTLAQTAPVRVDDALKGLTSGVTVTSATGQPGAAAQVRIRGIGTINNSDPLYIVDGMPIEGGIDYLNPADIKSIEVLKDAASGAVYGARAANGVILVTTKAGENGRAKVTYDFTYGWQRRSKKIHMMNATEYAVMKNEGYLNMGQAAPYADPYSLGEGYDWQDAIFYNEAPLQSHQATVSGATEKVNYFVSLGYYDQKGIIGGQYGQSDYNRLTMRSNLNMTVFDESAKRSWLNKLTIQTNISYARIHSKGLGAENGYYGGAITNALGMSPLLAPVLYGADAQAQLDYYANTPNYIPRYTADGGLYTIPEAWGGGYQELTNPLYAFSFPAGKNWSHKFVANFIGELQIWDQIRYRISYGADLSFWGSESHSEARYENNLHSTTVDQASASSSWNRGYVWQIENLLTYDKNFGENHINVVLGQSAKQSTGYYLGASANMLYNYDKPYVDVAQAQAGTGDNGQNRNGWGGPNNAWPKLLSYFGRVSYDYGSRYMAQFTIRRDGSSRFGSNNKWATFPSVSLGWNLTNEPFLEKRPEWWSNTKVRFSWGKNGNESIGDYRYTVTASGNNNYYFGPEGSGQWYGSKANGLANPDLRWEESKQTDVGLDLAFLNNSLQFTVDYYYKKTDGMLMEMMIPTYVGESKPLGNVGTMENRGVEMELRWLRRFGEWNISLGGNLTWQKNKLIDLGNADGWMALASNSTAGTISRAMNGEEFPYFYGFKTGGVIQNQAQADAYNSQYGLTPSDQFYAVPGDLIYLDSNNDGTITFDDRTKIGKGMPTWTYGFNLGIEWKGIQLTAYFQGVWGNKIYDASLRGDTPAKNMPAWMLNRWTGEGTSNYLPRFLISDPRNWQSSDIYLSDGAYCRLRNLTVSYTFPSNLIRKVGFQNFRVFVSAENLFTITKYHGFDPEVGSGTGIGIDYGVYPQARIFNVGFNITI
ncbi:MAG: TonB-dependent receptor [Muribaculaceae bacterium]|nr:TonB-dependent receptor [Muribaculaceae bacterium]